MTESIAQIEAHRIALTGHCYRMLGSATDADDAAQDTIIRAWRSIDRFDGRSSLRTWLYRIATNVCLDALHHRSRRFTPFDEQRAGSPEDALITKPRVHWLEPIADVKAVPANADPAERLMLQQSIRLAFVAALQYLPPKQRAVLILMEVLDWSAAETAAALDLSLASVNSALQRARATMATRDIRAVGELPEGQAQLLERYVDAFLRYDVDELVELLHQDAKMCMPPISLWLQGRQDIKAFLLGHGNGCRGSRLLKTSACGVPAFAQYRIDPAGGFKAWGLILLESNGNHVTGWCSFLDTEVLFPHFDLPLTLPA